MKLTGPKQQDVGTATFRGSFKRFRVSVTVKSTAWLHSLQQLRHLKERKSKAKNSSSRLHQQRDSAVATEASSPKADKKQNIYQRIQKCAIPLKRQGRKDENAKRIRAASRISSTPLWLLNRRKNEEDSTLYTLPNEVLLNIFGAADFLTQQMIRQTCSLFAELVASLDPKRAQEPREDADFLQIWPYHGTSEQRHEVRRQWSTLIRRDTTDFCPKCVDFEQSGRLNESIWRLETRIWCDACCEYHKRGFFSSSQRKPRLRSRKCIGWEGRLRLCSHVSLGWDRILAEKRKVKSLRQRRIGCLLNLQCPKDCHWPGSYNSFYPKRATQNGLNHRYYNWIANTDQTRALGMFASWANHIFDIDTTLPLTRHVFRKALEKLNVDGRGPRLCPHMRIDDGQLSLALGPEVCSPSSNRPEPGFEVKGHKHEEKRLLPRIREIAANSKSQSIDVELYNGGFARKLSCNVCHSMYLWRRCENTIHLEFSTRIPLSSATDSAWIRLLDPHSWNITGDTETRHVYWCPDTECRTNRHWICFYNRLWEYM